MKNYNFSLLIYFLIGNIAFSDCDGVSVDFLKSPYADWTLSENQDSLAPTVKITRKDNQNLFNIAQEEGYSGNNGSPVGTLWANSTTQNASVEDYTNFVTMHGGNPTSLIGTTVSLYLPDYGLYYDVELTSFSSGNSGGGFGWTRTCVAELNIDNQIIVTTFQLEPVYPNPFNPVTNIKYSVPENTSISIKVYDINGNIIKELYNGSQVAGTYNLSWDADNQPSGLYFIKMTANNFTKTQKLMLVK